MTSVYLERSLVFLCNVLIRHINLYILYLNDIFVHIAVLLVIMLYAWSWTAWAEGICAYICIIYFYKFLTDTLSKNCRFYRKGNRSLVYRVGVRCSVWMDVPGCCYILSLAVFKMIIHYIDYTNTIQVNIWMSNVYLNEYL